MELYQVWVQKTAADTYAKLLVKEILDEEDEGGNQFNVVVADFTYQPNGSANFPIGAARWATAPFLSWGMNFALLGFLLYLSSSSWWAS
ncbi:MAG: hypothetical protein R2751_00595 [Bacteroidales bacterium]